MPSAIWPNYTNARFTGQVSYDVASSFSSVAAQHASALAYLPVGTTTNATKLKYLLFKVNDATVVMAQEWINSSTLKQVSTGTVTVVNGADYAVLANLQTGTYPQTIAVDPQSHAVYVTNKARGLPRNAPAGTPVPVDPAGDTVTLIRP